MQQQPYWRISFDGGEDVRTTLNIEDSLIERASRLTGIKEKTALVKLGLEALIAEQSAKRLTGLGGSEKELKPISRKRANRKRSLLERSILIRICAARFSLEQEQRKGSRRSSFQKRLESRRDTFPIWSVESGRLQRIWPGD